MMLEFLWRAGQRMNDRRYFGAGGAHSDAHRRGGIYDHLGGGFSRYSVDESWLVPHFEKMLYDNALLLELLALAYQRSANGLFRIRARETVAWLAREMTAPEGAFCASLDADSEGEEGSSTSGRSPRSRRCSARTMPNFAAHYDVTVQGNFEGHNIPNRLKHLPRSMEDEARLAPMREKLLAARARRVRPGLDDKVLADWNGLMIAALVTASLAFEEPAWLAMAARASFLCVDAKMAHGDRLGHSWRAGRLVVPALPPITPP